jgi:hypothetical protein
MLQTREIYWVTAGKEWSLATIKPHIWRAIFDELTQLAIQNYWADFVDAKIQSVKVSISIPLLPVRNLRDLCIIFAGWTARGQITMANR